MVAYLHRTPISRSFAFVRHVVASSRWLCHACPWVVACDSRRSPVCLPGSWRRLEWIHHTSVTVLLNGICQRSFCLALVGLGRFRFADILAEVGCPLSNSIIPHQGRFCQVSRRQDGRTSLLYSSNI